MYMCVCIYGYVEIECRVAEYLLSVTLCVCVCVCAMRPQQCPTTVVFVPNVVFHKYIFQPS